MKGILLDTSFFVRLLNIEDPLHNNAKQYYRYFLEHEIELKVSTISIAEFCTKGSLYDLPFKDLKVLPFNIDHAVKAGEFAQIIHENKKQGKIETNPRMIIPNDTKLFSQAEIDDNIDAYISSDTRSFNIYSVLKSECNLNFEFMDMNISYNTRFGILDFEQ